MTTALLVPALTYPRHQSSQAGMKTRRGEGVKGDNRKIWEGKEGGGGGVREGEDATRRRMECRTEAYIDTLPAGQADLQLISIVLYSNGSTYCSLQVDSVRGMVLCRSQCSPINMQYGG